MERCGWCLCNEKMVKYHDEEWGVPVHDDRKQFEYLMMEAMQCGLKWNMMIQKREIIKRVCIRCHGHQRVPICAGRFIYGIVVIRIRLTDDGTVLLQGQFHRVCRMEDVQAGGVQDGLGKGAVLFHLFHIN